MESDLSPGSSQTLEDAGHNELCESAADPDSHTYRSRAEDTFTSHIRTPTGTPITTVQSLCNGNATNSWVQVTTDLSSVLTAYKGQQIQLYFQGTTNASLPSDFFVDDVSLTVSSSKQVTDPNSHTTSFGYDSAGRVTVITAPDGTTSQTGWTGDNHLAWEKVLSGPTASYSYDGNNNLLKVNLPTAAHATWAYGNASLPYLPTSFTDTQGNTTTFGYTAGGLLNQVTDSLGHSSSASYNTNGTIGSVTDENNHVTSFGYTPSGLPNRTTYPAPLGGTSATYNSYDLVASDTDGKAQTTTYSYDLLGQMTSTGYAGGSSIGYAYDANGYQTAMTDPGTAGTTTYSYNRLDQLTQKTLPNGTSIAYTYDGADNLLSKTDGGGAVSYSYTANDQVATVTDPQSKQTGYSYDLDGNLTKVSYPNGVSQTMAYNDAAMLTQIAAATSAGTTLTSFSYSYTNPATNAPTTQRSSMTDASGNVTNYTYDVLNRLTQALQKNSAGSQIASYGYAYDAVGNMTSTTVNGTTTAMTVNAADQLTSAGSSTYSYDANGNRTGTSAGGSLSYNSLDQTTSITPAGSPSMAMTYTGAGQSSRTAGGTNRWQYDGTGIGSMTTSAGTTYFTNSPDGDLLSERTPTDTYYYLYDGLGSVVALTDSTGTVVNRYSYDPYGKTLSATEGVSNPFRYIGAIWDSATGLYKMGERYYDPGVARFTQEDPLGGGLGYTGGDPINFADPSGLAAKPWAQGGAPRKWR